MTTYLAKAGQKPRRAVFRADGGGVRGFGHWARCAAIAEYLSLLGWECILATASAAALPDGFRGFADVVRLAPSDEASAGALRRAVAWAEILFVDHYGLDATFERACRGWARRVVAIDDLADRMHDADVLLDAAEEGRAAAYRGLVPPHCESLAGPEHAPLRPPFFTLRLGAGQRRLGRVLIDLGSAQSPELVACAAAAARDAAPQAEIDIVAPPAVADVIGAAVRHGAPAKVHAGTPRLAELMAAADLAIGACGVSAWERCAIGVPSVALVTAANQRHVAEALRRHRAATVVNDPAALPAAVKALAGDAELRAAMRAAALHLCDGLGAARLAAALDRDTAGAAGLPVRLRPARIGDTERMLAWQSDPRTRAFAKNPSVPSAEEHARWVRQKLGDPACLLQIVLCSGEAAGVLRLDLAAVAPEAWVVSVYTAPSHYRRGVARAALALAQRLRPCARFIAEVLPDNVPSHALFRAAGYRPSAAGYECPPFRESLLSAAS